MTKIKHYTSEELLMNSHKSESIKAFASQELQLLHFVKRSKSLSSRQISKFLYLFCSSVSSSSSTSLSSIFIKKTEQYFSGWICERAAVALIKNPKFYSVRSFNLLLWLETYMVGFFNVLFSARSFVLIS